MKNIFFLISIGLQAEEGLRIARSYIFNLWFSVRRERKSQQVCVSLVKFYNIVDMLDKCN